jgi:hypothetical protein
MWSWDRIPVKSIFFLFHAAAMLLFSYIIQRINIPKFYILQKYKIIYDRIASGTGVDPHKFVHPSCWYYHLQDTEK